MARAALAAVWLTLPGPGRTAAGAAGDPTRPAETRRVELHRLTNEALLKQAEAVYGKVARDYLAQLRALATAETMLRAVQEQTDAEGVFPAPATDTDAGQSSGQDAAKKAVDAARANRDAARRKRKLVQTRKDLLDRVTTALEACQSTAVAFQNALDDLRAYALETGLRVKDGSLAEDKVPSWLKPGFLDKKKNGLRDDRARLRTKSADVQRGQQAVVRLLEKADKAVRAADADVVEASKNLLREQQRQELEKAYQGKAPDEMVAELANMVEEGMGLKGTYQLALRKFDARAVDAARLRRELNTLRPPDVKIPRLTRAEDVETAARSIQKLIAFYAARQKKIEELRAALTALAREGGEFEADAAVSDEHLFKMQVLARLLRRKGISDDKLPARARKAVLDPATLRQKQSASAVRAATEKARAEIVLLDRQLADAGAARQAAAQQLANLKESRDVTLAALQWEARLKGMTGPQVVRAFGSTQKQLADRLGNLKGKAAEYHKAAAAVAEAKARLDGLKDPFLRTAEEQGQAERQKLIAELRKEAGLERTSSTAAAADTPKKADPDKKPKPDTRDELEKLTDHLLVFQQLLQGRVRVLDERRVKKKDLQAALDRLKDKGTGYSSTLADARLLALQLNATAVDLKKRYGKGDLTGDKIPDGLTDALRLELRAKLDVTATAVLNSLNQLQQDRDVLARPDPQGEALAVATRDILTIVGRRLDLLGDLGRLAADYRRDRSARPPSEVKRLEQRAAERLDNESSGWDTLLGIDSSRPARSLSELLESCYRELIEIEDREDNLKRRREKVDQLVELTRKETGALNRVLPLLARQLTELEAAREEEAVLARARLRPERAEELLRAYQTKTGRLLTKPLPIPEGEKAAKVEELGNLLFERYATLEAARKWGEVLGGRDAGGGIKAEAGVYQDQLAQMNAATAANVRRVVALTGREGSGPATGGEIARTREELARVRTRGIRRIGLTIAGILLAAFLLPRLLTLALRRVLGLPSADGSSLVFSAVRAVLKTTVWVTAVILILHLLGVNVTAIIAGLGIFGLAIGLAAQPMIADVLGAVVIFAERRFKIGDVIRFGNDEPMRVIGLNWRSTQVLSAEGLVVTIPNRKVTEATIQNLTRAGETYDSLNVTVTTQKDVTDVLAVIKRAIKECESLAADHQVSVREFNQKGETRTIKYRFSWFLTDYQTRNHTRAAVFERVSARLADEDMAGTEISLA